MKVRGAKIVVRALEDEGVRFTFGIPGTHNIELYDALADSDLIEPILVTDEQSASFMADGVSRTSSMIGVVNVVPGAGVTHCLSGVAEAYMDNVPMVILACGIRSDTGHAYQLHDIDQLAVLRPVTKEVFKVREANEIYSTVRKAFAVARSGTPGPVAVEVPADLYILHHDVQDQDMVYDEQLMPAPRPSDDDLNRVASILKSARHPALYVGNGASVASDLVVKLAEKLSAPVTTTIQGKGVFPESHPLWLWNGFGAAAPPFVRTVMARCDCLLAIGCRFSETGTASYGLTPPDNLIHVDINDEVFNRNYKARLAIQSDAALFISGLLPLLGEARKNVQLEAEIADGHKKVRDEWQSHPSGDRVSPFAFFETLQRLAGKNAVYVTDSGSGTFLAMEHLRLDRPGCFIGPIDYSCMGYSVPAAIGAKFADPERDVIALVGDGALLMTGLEMLTAASYKVAPLVCVLRDGELGQIAQFQRTSLGRNTCSVLAQYSVESFAQAANCRYLNLATDSDIDRVLAEAFEMSRMGEPAMVDVAIDYSQKTYFTKGVITTNFWRLPWGERLRMIARVVGRRVLGSAKKC